MNPQEFQNDKLNIINWITQIQDQSLVDKIKELMPMETSKNKDWYDLLSNNEKKAIDKGIKDADSDNTIPHEQVMQSVKSKINQLKNQ